jgi:hypothetical protein
MRMTLLAIIVFLNLPSLWAGQPEPPEPLTVTDYDEGDCYLVRGDQKLPYHGMRNAWVYNRAMTWLDQTASVEGATPNNRTMDSTGGNDCQNLA